MCLSVLLLRYKVIIEVLERVKQGHEYEGKQGATASGLLQSLQRKGVMVAATLIAEIIKITGNNLFQHLIQT